MLSVVCKVGDEDVVMKVIEGGVDVNECDVFG